MKTAAILPALLLSVAAPAVAQTLSLDCAPRDGVVAMLSNDYGEIPLAIGVAGPNAGVMELFASDSTGTWTVTLTLPDGRTCLVASGSGFTTMIGRLPATL